MVLSLQEKYFYPLGHLIHPYLDVKIALNYIFFSIVGDFILYGFFMRVTSFVQHEVQNETVSHCSWFDLFTSKYLYWSILLAWAFGYLPVGGYYKYFCYEYTNMFFYTQVLHLCCEHIQK